MARFEKLAGSGERFSVLSEEVGQRDFGAAYPMVVMDPIDGSLNAKQGVPLYAIMLTLIDGPTVASVRAGYVMNLVNGEQFSAVRGGGAEHNGRRLDPLRRPNLERIALVAMESTPRGILEAAPLLKRAEKVRILGSMAISIAHVATGSFDIFCSPMQSRVFDMTASLLVLTEAGGVATDLAGGSLAELPVGFAVRTTLLAATDARAHALALEILANG